MDSKLTGCCFLGVSIATLGLSSCKTLSGDNCKRPEVPLARPLRLNVMREVQPHSFVALVIDQATNQPVMRASVWFPLLRRAAFTDSSGVAQIPNVPKGTHTVEIRQFGYLRRSARIEMSDTAGVMAAYELARDTVVLCNVTITALKQY